MSTSMRWLVALSTIVSLGLAGCDQADPEVALDTAELSVSPSSVAFGLVRIGQNASRSSTVAAGPNETRVVNAIIESCPDFMVTGYELRTCDAFGCTGDTSPSFPVVVYQDSSTGDLADLTIFLRFTPTSRGVEQTCAVRVDLASGIDPTIQLTGTGIAPVLTLVTPATGLDFGQRRINTSSAAMTFTVRNDGDAGQALTFSSVAPLASATSWSVSLDTSTALAVGASRSGTVVFAPKVAADLGTTLRILSNDPVDADEAFALVGTGTTALINAPVTPIDLGRVVVGQPATATLAVSNPGTGALTLASFDVTGLTPADFTITAPAFPVAIAPSSTVNLTVRCRPAALGSRTATLRLDSDADNTPQDPSVDLACIGTRPDITVNTASLGFGNVAPGGAVTQQVVVSNADGVYASTLAVDAPILIGADAAVFTVSPTGAFALAPGASRTINVTFSPTGFGARTATLRLTSDDQDNPTSDVALSGTGFAPEITLVAPTSGAIGFGDVRVGQTSAAQAVQVRNDGNASLAINGAILMGASPGEFRLTGPVTASLAGGATASWTVTCVPGGTGARAAILRVTSNDASEPTTDVALTCNGTQGSLVVSSPATPVAFPATDVGASSAPLAIRLQNAGTATVTITGSPTVSPSTYALAGLALEVPFELAPGASTTIQVRFTPAVDGTVDGTLTVPYDGTSLSAGLRATGQAALVTVTPSSIGHGAVRVDASADRTFSIQNTGSDALAVAAITRSGSADLAVVGAAPDSVPPGGAVTVTVRCTPTAVGTRTATFSVDTDADNLPQDPAITATCLGVQLDVTVTPPMLAFGDVAPGTSTTLEVTVQNASGPTVSEATFAAPSLSGSAAADYAISPASSFVLAPGDIRTLVVTFTPSTIGARAASLTISSDDPDAPTQVVTLAGIGRTRELTVVTPTGTIAFGDVKVGATSSVAPITLRDDGNDTLTITSLTVGGPHAAHFHLDGPATPAMIAAGATATWELTCAPTIVGDKTATVTIGTDDADEPSTALTASCRGTSANLARTAPSGTPVSFATTRVGETSPDVVITLANDGTAPLTIVAPPVVNPPSFTITTPFAQATPFQLAPGASATVGLRFAPTQTGDVDGTLEVNWDAASLLVPLRGPGRVAIASVLPEPDQDGDVDLGAVCVGQPRIQNLTMLSTGTAAFQVISVAVDGAGFAVAPTTPATLPATIVPGQTATFALTVSPALGDAAGTVTITTDIPGAPTHSIPVTAVGLASGIGVAPTDGIDFGVVEVDSSSAPQPVTVTNCEVGPMVISAVTLAGAAPAQFAIVEGTEPPPALTIAPTESAQWSVAFAPDHGGAAAAVLRVEHDLDVGDGTIEVALVGTAPGSDPDDPDAGVPDPDAGSGNDAGGGGGVDGGGDGDAGDAAVDGDSYYGCATGGRSGGGGLVVVLAALLAARRRRGSHR